MNKTNTILELIATGKVATANGIREHIEESTQGTVAGLLHSLVRNGCLVASTTKPRTYEITERGRAKLALAKLQKEEVDGSLG